MLAPDCGRVEVEDTTVAAGKDDVVLDHLTLASLSSCLGDRFRQRREAPHVVPGELAASGVGGKRATGAELAVGNEGPAVTLLTEAVVLEGHQDRVGVAVVELEDVDVIVPQASQGEGLFARLLRTGDDPRLVSYCLVVSGGRLRSRLEVDGRLP